MSMHATRTILAALWLGCAAFVHPCFAQSSNGEPVPVLLERAAALDNPDSVTISVSVTDEFLYEWEVKATDALVASLPNSNSPEFDVRASLITWISEANTRLGDLTKQYVEETGCDPLFNPATDVRATFSAKLPGRNDTKIVDRESLERLRKRTIRASFIGPRPIWGIGVELPEPNIVEGTELTVELLPDRAEWEFRETIKGTLIFRNTGATRVPLPYHLARYGAATLTDMHGDAPEYFRMRGHINWGRQKFAYRFIAPGESIQIRFSIHTDQRASMVNGYIVPKGKWLVTHLDLLEGHNVPMRLLPARIEVKSAGGQYIGPRIVGARPAGPNLLLVREDGLHEFVDVSNGERRGNFSNSRRANGYDRWMWKNVIVCPDGRVIAKHGQQLQVVEMNGTTSSVHLPEALKNASPRRLLSNQRLLCATKTGMLEIDLATGEILVAADTPVNWPRFSGDGRFAASVDSPRKVFNQQDRGADQISVQIAERMNPDSARTVTLNGHGVWPDTLYGVNALYLVDAFNPGVLMLPYASDDPLLLDTGTVGLEYESPDGRLIALSNPGGPAAENHDGAKTIEVWDTQTRTMRYKIEFDEDVRACFVTNPLRLICLPRTHTTSTTFAERVMVYDGEAGEFIRETDLTPPELADLEN